MAKRATRPLTFIKQLSAQGLPWRLTFPDGTVLESVGPANDLGTINTQPGNGLNVDREFDEWLAAGKLG
jgi:hypothetical protein